MKKVQCKEALDIYKKFLTRMARISEFLKVAEASQEHSWSNLGLSHLTVSAFFLTTCLTLCALFLQQVGIDRGDIPDLSQVSKSSPLLLDAPASKITIHHLCSHFQQLALRQLSLSHLFAGFAFLKCEKWPNVWKLILFLIFHTKKMALEYRVQMDLHIHSTKYTFRWENRAD